MLLLFARIEAHFWVFSFATIHTCALNLAKRCRPSYYCQNVRPRPSSPCATNGREAAGWYRELALKTEVAEARKSKELKR